ncbi:MAG: hypothetical protein ACT4P6_18790 [Gemmatimonadaceae bacterium]
MRFLRDVAIITGLMALGTWLLGWWAVPLVAALAAAWDRNRRASVGKSALAAPIAWGSLLLLQGLLGSSVSQLGRDLAVSLGVPAALPLTLTLLVPLLLAAASAGTMVAIKRLRSRPPPLVAP